MPSISMRCVKIMLLESSCWLGLIFCPYSLNPFCFVCCFWWSYTSYASPGEGDDLPALRGLRVRPCPSPWEARKTCQDRSPGAKNINNNNNKISKRSTVDFPRLFNRCHLSLFVPGFIFAYYDTCFRILTIKVPESKKMKKVRLVVWKVTVTSWKYIPCI